MCGIKFPILLYNGCNLTLQLIINKERQIIQEHAFKYINAVALFVISIVAQTKNSLEGTV